jgi:hypothetical protein
MLDITNGQINIGDQFKLHPNLLLQQFDASPYIAKWVKMTIPRSKRLSSYKVEIDDKDWGIVTIQADFIDSVLHLVTLSLHSLNDLTSAERILDRQLERREIYHNFLQQRFGAPPYVYPWGYISLVNRAEENVPVIGIKYHSNPTSS